MKIEAPLANLTETITMVQNGAATLVRPETSLPPMSLKASPSAPRTDKRASQFERGKCLMPVFSYLFPLVLIINDKRRSRIHWFRVLAMIDSVAKTFDSGIAPFSVATAGINACQLLLCQLSGMTLTRNHGGSEINKYSLRAWTYGSYTCRNSESFCSVAVPARMLISASANIFRNTVKLEGGRRSGAGAGGERMKF